MRCASRGAVDTCCIRYSAHAVILLIQKPKDIRPFQKTACIISHFAGYSNDLSRQLSKQDVPSGLNGSASLFLAVARWLQTSRSEAGGHKNAFVRRESRVQPPRRDIDGFGVVN